MAKKNTEVAVKTGGAVQAVPEYLQGKGRGMENVDAGDIAIPRVKLLQDGSPEVINGQHKEGLMVDSVTSEPLGKEGKEIEFIPVMHFKSRIMFDGIGADATIECSSADAVMSADRQSCLECKSGQWTQDKKGKSVKPSCTLFYNFPIIITNMKAPVLAALSMSSTKITAAKKLLTMVKHAGGNVDMFGCKFKLTTVKVTTGIKPYYTYVVSGMGFATETEYKNAEKLFESLKKVDVAEKLHGGDNDNAAAEAPLKKGKNSRI